MLFISRSHYTTLQTVWYNLAPVNQKGDADEPSRPDAVFWPQSIKKGTLMNPADLTLFLDGLIQNRLKLSTMIWGPPGIGKSSIVTQTAAKHGFDCVDLRLSQLAPTDLRGLP